MPRCSEGVGTLALQPMGQRFIVHTFAPELFQHFIGIAAVNRQRRAHLAVVCKGCQGLFRDGVDGVGRGQRLDIQRVSRRRVLGARACPQKPLRPRAGLGQLVPARRCEQVAIGLVGAHRHRDAQAVVERWRDFLLHRHVPAADEKRSHGAHVRIPACQEAAFKAPHVGLCCRQILLGRKEQGHVHRHAREYRLLDGLGTRCGTGYLDKEVWPVCGFMQPGCRLNRLGGVVRQQRRHLERNPAVKSFGRVEHRAKQVGRHGEVFQCPRKEQLLGRFMAPRQPRDRLVVEAAVGNGVFEDRRVRRQPGHRPLGDVARESPAHQHFAADVVDPDALAHVVQFFCVRIHRLS